MALLDLCFFIGGDLARLYQNGQPRGSDVFLPHLVIERIEPLSQHIVVERLFLRAGALREMDLA